MIPLGHEDFMRIALEEAEEALSLGEVPVGAALVMDGEVVARAHNRRETAHDPTAHAEVLVLRRASAKLDRWRLTGAALYVTKEPCTMCAGAITLARVSALIFGCSDPKAGACGSALQVLNSPASNHRVEVISGVLEGECARLLRDFFRERRGTNG